MLTYEETGNYILKTWADTAGFRYVNDPIYRIEKPEENSNKQVWNHLYIQSIKSFDVWGIQLKSNFNAGEICDISAPTEPFTFKESEWYEEG